MAFNIYEIRHSLLFLKVIASLVQMRSRIFNSIWKIHEMVQADDPDIFSPQGKIGFFCVFFRNIYVFHVLTESRHHGEYPFYRHCSSLQGKFSHKSLSHKMVLLELSSQDHYGRRYGKIEMASLLTYPRGIKVYRDPSLRIIESAVIYSGPDPFSRFLYGAVSEAYHMKTWKSP